MKCRNCGFEDFIEVFVDEAYKSDPEAFNSGSDSPTFLCPECGMNPKDEPTEGYWRYKVEFCVRAKNTEEFNAKYRQMKAIAEREVR